MTRHAQAGDLQCLARDFLLPACDHEQVAEQPVEIEFIKFVERRFVTARHPGGQRQHVRRLLCFCRHFRGDFDRRIQKRRSDARSGEMVAIDHPVKGSLVFGIIRAFVVRFFL